MGRSFEAAFLQRAVEGTLPAAFVLIPRMCLGSGAMRQGQGEPSRVRCPARGSHTCLACRKDLTRVHSPRVRARRAAACVTLPDRGGWADCSRPFDRTPLSHEKQRVPNTGNNSAIEPTHCSVGARYMDQVWPCRPGARSRGGDVTGTYMGPSALTQGACRVGLRYTQAHPCLGCRAWAGPPSRGHQGGGPGEAGAGHQPLSICGPCRVSVPLPRLHGRL